MKSKHLLSTSAGIALLFAFEMQAQTMPLYLNFNSHNEISDNIQYSNSTIWSQYRQIVTSIADTFYIHGVKWNLQAESDFIRADISNENGYANNNDLLDSLDNTATVEVDPHNHFDNNSSSMSYNPYNYTDVAHLLDSAGLTPARTNMGGFLYTTASDFMPYQNPVAGNMYPQTANNWHPNVIWGAGSPGHTNDYNGYGVWKPSGANVAFFTHDPAKHLTFIGNGCSFVIFDTTHVSTIVNQVAEMIQYISYQPYNSMAMYTASIQMNFRSFTTPGYMDTVAAIVRGLEQYRNNGTIIYQTLTEKYTTWYTAHTTSSDHFEVDCTSLPPMGVEENTTHSELAIFPNPAVSVLTIENDNDPIEEIEVFDVQGKCVFSQKTSAVTSTEIDVSSYDTGIYLIRIESSSGSTQHRKFIKQ